MCFMGSCFNTSNVYGCTEKWSSLGQSNNVAHIVPTFLCWNLYYCSFFEIIYIRTLLHYFIKQCTRFKDRILIPDSNTRKLLSSFCLTGLNSDQYLMLKAKLMESIPSLLPVLEIATLRSDDSILYRSNECWKDIFEIMLQLFSSVCNITQ